jgi:hypothetical protein
MSKISMETRLYLALIGANLIILGFFFFIIGLIKIYGESPILPILEISFVVIGSIMIFVGLKGFSRKSPKSEVLRFVTALCLRY